MSSATERRSMDQDDVLNAQCERKDSAKRNPSKAGTRGTLGYGQLAAELPFQQASMTH